MTIKDSLKLKSLPGLADWAEWGEAIAKSYGIPRNGIHKRLQT